MGHSSISGHGEDIVKNRPDLFEMRKPLQDWRIPQNYEPNTNKPYTCVFCPYKATRKDYLTKHMRIHTGEKPYQCDQCSYSSADRSTLTKHKRVHTGEKPYKCTMCSYTAAQVGGLHYHIAHHHA